MVKKINDFLAGLPMTIVAGIFLLNSAGRLICIFFLLTLPGSRW